MPDLSSFTQGTSNIASSDFLIGYVSAAGPGSERRWTAQDITTGLLSLAGATPGELAHLSGTTGNIQSQFNVVQADIDAHEARTDNPHTVTATQVGLGNVDNTSDTDKPVSTLQASAIGVVQSDVNAHEARIDNPHTVTATQVGLGNVDNTSDANKPVSTLQQAAIDAAGGGAFDADGNTLITPSTPIVLGQATGNEAALTLDYTTNKATSGDDTGLLINQTDFSSPGTSKLLDLQVGGASKLSVDATGKLTAPYLELTNTAGAVFTKWDGTTRIFSVGGEAFAVSTSSGETKLYDNGAFGWTSNIASTGNLDLILRRDSAATLQLGTNHATVATGQTIKAHDVVTGTGAALTLSGGTGSVANGAVILQPTSGNVGIGTTTPDANAILDVSSTTKAFLPPRMTTTEKNAVASPTAGMLVYDSTLNKLAVYTGAAWEAITSA